MGDLAVKKIWSDQDLSEFSKVNLMRGGDWVIPGARAIEAF